MPVKIGIATKVISTKDFYDRFEPPLQFACWSRLANDEMYRAWVQLQATLTEDKQDKPEQKELAITIFASLVKSVSDGNGSDTFPNVEAVERWYDDVEQVFGLSTHDVFVTMVYSLVVEYLDLKKKLSAMREKQQGVSSSTEVKSPKAKK